MGGFRLTSGGSATIVVPLAAASLVLTGCRSPVPFHGRPGAQAPMLVIGGPAPYAPPRRPPDPAPAAAAPREDQPDLYAATRAGMLSPAVRRTPSRVYVPDGAGGTVTVIDPATYRVVRRIKVGREPRHVVPSWDLRTLWVTVRGGLVPIDPRTGAKGRKVPMSAPFDLYFSVDGEDALVMNARRGRIEIRDPHTMRRRSTVRVPCHGLTRADFSASGSSLVVGCAGAGRLARVDLDRRRVTGMLRLAADARPQDVRLSPDGGTFYVTDTRRGGVWTIDAPRFRTTGFVPTGRGAYGLVPSRDGSVLYVTNTGARTVSLISFADARVTGEWRVPVAPDLAGVSADGRVLWLSARDADAVLAVSTRTGRTIRRIAAGPGPFGLCVHPQPGRFSLGNTGNYR